MTCSSPSRASREPKLSCNTPSSSSSSSWELKQALGAASHVDDSETELALCFKHLTSLQPICRSLTSLTNLNASFNALPNLRGIEALRNLQQLNISHNSKLTSLDQVSALQSLTQLNAAHNAISTTGCLVNLQLQFLALHNNSISTASEALGLSHLTCLKHLTLCNNAVCKQERWQDATIAVLPSLQTLDGVLISTERRAAASACADVWAAAGQQQYTESCSTPGAGGSVNSNAGSDPADAGVNNPGASYSRMSSGSSRRSSGSAGRLRPRVQPAVPLDDSVSIKDATSLLPSMSLQPMKPSSLVRRPAGAAQPPSKYGYSMAKPLRVINKQTYTGSPSTGSAVLIHSDGSASLTWPEGSMAATLDPEEPPPPGSMASGSAGVSNSSSTAPPIRGYRLLAMHRNVAGAQLQVAASFDSNGGFVQYPNGQLMLVWDKKEGTVYEANGRVTHKFTNKRRSAGALTEDITARLDQHLSIRFSAASCDLQLNFTCEGCQATLSQQHGPVLPEREVATQVAQPAAAAAAPQPRDDVREADDDGGGGGPGSTTEAVADLPGGDAMQALLARARALMEATDADDSQANPVTEEEAGGVGQACSHVVAAEHEVADAGDSSEGVHTELQDMLVRARAAVAALQL